jgi:hypothetical protein
MDWKIIATGVWKIIIFGPFFTGSSHFDSPKDEIFVVPTFFFLKNFYKKIISIQWSFRG